MYDILTVYHGGTDIIQSPRVDAGRQEPDFGPGFYITDIYSQAKDWANKMAEILESSPILNIYHLHQKEILSVSNFLRFETYDMDWLEFVTQSRLGQTPWKGYDYIEGGVADDRVVNTIQLYMGGYIPAEVALSRLRYFKPTNQICLLNQQLTDQYLSFIESKNLIDIV